MLLYVKCIQNVTKSSLCCSGHALADVSSQDDEVTSTTMQQCHSAEDGQMQVHLCMCNSSAVVLVFAFNVQ